jgi:MYXO-CTERM domain-containing protein
MPRGSRTAKRLAVAGFVIGVLGALGANEAEAHFVLESPPTWMTQDSLGLPEKLGPCGDEYDGTDAAVPTGTVTAVREGQKIKVTINEVIFHPGHYRISLAKTRSELPVEPVVTVGTTPCGSAAVMDPPVFPVLADGVFTHTTAFTSPQTIEITLPAGLTCPKCTLQVIEFMAQHALNNPGGCFYHHCADLSIEAPADAASPPVDSGGPSVDSSQPPPDMDAAPTDDASVAAEAGGGYLRPPTPTSSSGCGVAPGAVTGGAWPAMLGALSLGFGARRRRRASSGV